MKRVYLAGPMRGYNEMNFPEFNRVARIWREYGHKVFNPAETDGGDLTKPRPYYLRKDLIELAKTEALILLVGWSFSPGARMEVTIAMELELPVYFSHDVVCSADLGYERLWVSISKDRIK
jgi:nucleoside 2-deoxyribosyltransferase